jgi:hypothetical protein
MSNPYHLNLDVYYTLDGYYDVCYAAFPAVAKNIYFLSLGSYIFWDLELYNNSAYSTLLGTPYSLPYPMGNLMEKYALFSPNQTKLYYLKLYCSSGFDGKLAVLTAAPYTVNTSQLIVISEESNPIAVLQVDLIQGNYSTSGSTLYARIERGWNYVLLPENYGTLSSRATYLPNGSYSLIIEASCNFRLSGYVFLKGNQTPPPPPPPDNRTDTNQGNPILNGVTPLFGIGVLVGLCALYKFKKK